MKLKKEKSYVSFKLLKFQNSFLMLFIWNFSSSNEFSFAKEKVSKMLFLKGEEKTAFKLEFAELVLQKKNWITLMYEKQESDT